MNRSFLFFAKFTVLLILFNTYSTNDVYSLDLETSYVSFRPDGQQIAVANREGEIKILDAITLQELNSFETSFTPTAPIWSPDSQMLGFGNGSSLEIWLNAWDSTTSQLIATLEPEIQSSRLVSASWSPSGSLIVATTGNRLTFWNASDFTEYTSFFGTVETVTDISWNETNDLITVSDISGNVNTLKISNPLEQYGIFLENFLTTSDTLISPAATAVDWSPDGEFLAFGGEDYLVRIVPLSVLQPYPILVSEIRTLVTIRLMSTVHDISWNTTGTMVAVSAGDGRITIWNATTGDQLSNVNLEDEIIVNSLSWSADGSQLAYGTSTGIGVEIIPAPVLNEAN